MHIYVGKYIQSGRICACINAPSMWGAKNNLYFNRTRLGDSLGSFICRMTGDARLVPSAESRGSAARKTNGRSARAEKRARPNRDVACHRRHLKMTTSKPTPAHQFHPLYRFYFHFIPAKFIFQRPRQIYSYLFFSIARNSLLATLSVLVVFLFRIFCFRWYTLLKFVANCSNFRFRNSVRRSGFARDYKLPVPRHLLECMRKKSGGANFDRKNERHKLYNWQSSMRHGRAPTFELGQAIIWKQFGIADYDLFWIDYSNSPGFMRIVSKKLSKGASIIFSPWNIFAKLTKKKRLLFTALHYKNEF